MSERRNVSGVDGASTQRLFQLHARTQDQGLKKNVEGSAAVLRPQGLDLRTCAGSPSTKHTLKLWCCRTNAPSSGVLDIYIFIYMYCTQHFWACQGGHLNVQLFLRVCSSHAHTYCTPCRARPLALRLSGPSTISSASIC